MQASFRQVTEILKVSRSAELNEMTTKTEKSILLLRD